MVAFFAASPVAQAVAAATRPLLGFQAVPASVADTIVVPTGYKAEVLIAWEMPSSPMPRLCPGQ
jgi:secreted PhoX family phosphatase